MNEQDRAAYDEWVAKGKPAGKIPGTQMIMTDSYEPIVVEGKVRAARRIDAFPFVSNFWDDVPKGEEKE